MKPKKRFLAYTIAFDLKGVSGCRILAKLLTSSLLRTDFDGDIVIFRNSPQPIFMIPKAGVYEVFIDADRQDGVELAHEAWRQKFLVRHHFPVRVENYEKVVFLDADSLALRNIDHLFDSKHDILYAPERGLHATSAQFSCFFKEDDLPSLSGWGVNSGTIAVRSDRYYQVMEDWEQIDRSEPPQPRCCSDQGSWNFLLKNKQYSKWPFERGELLFPMYLHTRYVEYSKAALVHCLGGSLAEKVRFTFGLFASTFYCDPTGLIVDMLDP
ncbi:hypothetical protein [Luteolibacter soli]|uniref:Glycosyl transferase n=1 Tax=Luteolibacter soli TaxID=3135280 RepID=A0ABU9B323_9BACT